MAATASMPTPPSSFANSYSECSEESKCGHCHCATMMDKLYWQRFVPLHFCQILIPGTGFHNHIEIPKKFAENSRVRLHPEVTLRGPGGATWHAITNTTGDKVFLSDGWEEFARAYSLQDGDILVFKYDGICVFDVLIFDGDSLCEKEAAYFVHKCENAKRFADPARKRVSTEVDIDELNDVHIHRATKKARKVLRKRKVSKMSKISQLYLNHWRKKRAHFKIVSAKTTKTVRQNTSANASYQNDEELRNSEADGKIETETTPPSGNDIHWTFATEPLQDAAVIHGGGWISEDETPAEDTSQINETIDVDASPFAGKEVGEVPSKGNPSGSTDSLDQNSLSGKDALEMARDQATESSFIVTMRPTAVQRHFVVHIPNLWYKRRLSLMIKAVLLRVGDKTWYTQVCHINNGARGSITTGWERFARENCLEEQDVCLFDLASQTDNTVILDVKIFRARQDTPGRTGTKENSSTIGVVS